MYQLRQLLCWSCRYLRSYTCVRTTIGRKESNFFKGNHESIPQVETYGSMTRLEKTFLILEQMRLCLAKEDFVRTQIIAKKISVKFFSDEKNEDVQYLKLKYYE